MHSCLYRNVDFDQLKVTTCFNLSNQTRPHGSPRDNTVNKMVQPSITAVLKLKAMDSAKAPKQPKIDCDENNNEESMKQPTSEEKSAKTRIKTFLDAWLKEFEWLMRKDAYNESPMFCSSSVSTSRTCKSLKSNAFVLGTVNFQKVRTGPTYEFG